MTKSHAILFLFVFVFISACNNINEANLKPEIGFYTWSIDNTWTENKGTFLRASNAVTVYTKCAEWNNGWMYSRNVTSPYRKINQVPVIRIDDDFFIKNKSLQGMADAIVQIASAIPNYSALQIDYDYNETFVETYSQLIQMIKTRCQKEIQITLNASRLKDKTWPKADMYFIMLYDMDYSDTSEWKQPLRLFAKPYALCLPIFCRYTLTKSNGIKQLLFFDDFSKITNNESFLFLGNGNYVCTSSTQVEGVGIVKNEVVHLEQNGINEVKFLHQQIGTLHNKQFKKLVYFSLSEQSMKNCNPKELQYY